MLPIDPSCEFGACLSGVEPFADGAVIEIAKIGSALVTAADALGIAIGVLLLQKGDASPRVRNKGCEQEWKEAREYCQKLLSKPNPPRGLTGGYKDVENCAKDFVSERCGGNVVDWGMLPHDNPIDPQKLYSEAIARSQDSVEGLAQINS